MGSRGVSVDGRQGSAITRIVRGFLRPAKLLSEGSFIANIKKGWPLLAKTGVGVTFLVTLAVFLETHQALILGAFAFLSFACLWTFVSHARQAIYLEVAEWPNALRCNLFEVKIDRQGFVFINFEVETVIPRRLTLPDIEFTGMMINGQEIVITKTSMLPSSGSFFDGGGSPCYVQTTSEVARRSWSIFAAVTKDSSFVSVGLLFTFSGKQIQYPQWPGHVTGVFSE